MARVGRSLGCVLWIALAACSTEPQLTPMPEPPDPIEEETDLGQVKEDLNTWLSSLDALDVPAEQSKKEIDCSDVCPPDGQEGDSYCTYTRYTETERFDKFVAFQPNSATLWPGSIVKGKDAQNGLLTPLGAPLAPVTFSLSLENITASPVGHMDDPSLSAFRDERNAILAQGVTGATPAALDFEIVQVNSESQLSLALGADVSWPGGGQVAASFNFDSSTKKTKVLVNFTQAYYTVDVDTPAQPADFFAAGTTVDDIKPLLTDGEPPLYIQSITFGRRVIFSVETDASAEEIKAALQATYTGAVNVSANVSYEQKQLLEQSTIRAFVLGGSGEDATGAINGFDGVVQYIQNGGNYSSDSPGAPIAYKLAYLDNSVAEMAFTTDYAERTCTKNRADLHVDLKSIKHVSGGDAGDNIEFYGYVGIQYPTPGNPVTSCGVGGEYADLWYLPDGSWITVPEFGTWTPPGGLSVDLYDVPVGPNQNVCIYIDVWDEDYSTSELSGDDDYGVGVKLLGWQAGWQGTQSVTSSGAGSNSAMATFGISVK